jgi:uncharacterized membrane protein (UPF0182 family)
MVKKLQCLPILLLCVLVPSTYLNISILYTTNNSIVSAPPLPSNFSTRVSIKSSLLLSICLIQHNTTCTIKHLHKTLPTLLTPNKTQKCAVPSSPVALNSLVRVAENTFSSILTISTGTVVLAGVLCSLLCRGEWQRGKLWVGDIYEGISYGVLGSGLWFVSSGGWFWVD